jgi:hypothetical protein
MIEYLHDNMVVHSKIFYTLVRGKRCYLEHPPTNNTNDPVTFFEFEASMYPPLFLLPLTWKRYSYNVQDIVSTYNKCEASYVWGIALMLLCGQYEPEASSAGVKPTFQSPFSFLFISRKTIFDVFLNAHRNYITNSNEPVLCEERPDHRPLLPKVVVDIDVWIAVKFMVPPKQPSFAYRVEYCTKFSFKDIFLIPVEYDDHNKLVYMVRIINKTVYDAISVKPKKCVVTLPIICTVKGVEYVLTEEACFYEQKHLKKRKGFTDKNKNKTYKKIKSIIDTC